MSDEVVNISSCTSADYSVREVGRAILGEIYALLARAERAEQMVERLIEAGKRLADWVDYDGDIVMLSDWHALVAEWEQRRKDD